MARAVSQADTGGSQALSAHALCLGGSGLGRCGPEGTWWLKGAVWMGHQPAVLLSQVLSRRPHMWPRSDSAHL